MKRVMLLHGCSDTGDVEFSGCSGPYFTGLQLRGSGGVRPSLRCLEVGDRSGKPFTAPEDVVAQYHSSLDRQEPESVPEGKTGEKCAGRPSGPCSQKWGTEQSRNPPMKRHKIGKTQTGRPIFTKIGGRTEPESVHRREENR